MASGVQRLAAGGRLPDLSLPLATGGGTVRLRPGARLNPVIVAVHGGGCERCRAYLRSLADAIAELREWDAHVVAIAPGAIASPADLPFPVAVDQERRFAARTGIDGAAVVIADQWGEVAHVARAGAGHELPDAGEIVEWVRFLAIQCPECEGEAL